MGKPNIIGLKTKQGQLMDILTIDDNKELNIDGVEIKNAIDYTAFEVMCRWETVYGEFTNGSYLGDLNEKTGYKYKKALPYTQSTGEGFTEKFILRTTTLQENQDIIVDWGDGTFSNVKNGDFESVSSSGFDYTMSHTYTQPIEFDKDVLDSNTTNKYRKTKRYIIKIYGKQYYGFRYTNIEPYNLMCRCLDWDLPVATHFTNLSSFCYGAKGLQAVSVPEYTTYLKNAINFSSMFDGPIPNNCSNLISVTGFGKNDNDINYACNFMFNNCTNLIECDFILPNLNTGSMANIFNNCSSLNVDINSLIPKQGFLHKEINVENLFNSTAISGNVPANLLWNDSNITWKNTSNTFSNCSDEIRAQVPVSWGGTASNNIIIKNQSYDDSQLRQLIANKVEKINGKGLSTNDFTNDDKTKLNNLKNYDDTEIQETLITKADLENGKVPASQLPSYVDDVIEGTIDLSNNSITDINGNSVEVESGKIYLDINTNKQYRWSGSKLSEISSSIALGETSLTAFPGDRGKALEDSIKNKADKSDVKEYSDGAGIEITEDGKLNIKGVSVYDEEVDGDYGLHITPSGLHFPSNRYVLKQDLIKYKGSDNITVAEDGTIDVTDEVALKSSIKNYSAGIGIEITDNDNININLKSFTRSVSNAGAQNPWLKYSEQLCIDNNLTDAYFLTDVSYPVIGAGENVWVTERAEVGGFGNGDFAEYRITIPEINNNSLYIKGAGIACINGIYNLENEDATGFDRVWVRYSFIKMSICYSTEQNAWIILVTGGNTSGTKYIGSSTIDPWDSTWTLLPPLREGETEDTPIVRKATNNNINRDEFEKTIGDINSILDAINGEEI